MSRNPYNLFTLFCLLLLAGSCFSNRITISVLEPAKLTLPASIQRISIFPEPGLRSKPGVFDSISKIVLDENADIREIKTGYLHGIYEILSTSPRFTKVVIADTSTGKFNANGILYWDDVERICKHDTTDVLLILKKAVSYDAVELINSYWIDNIYYSYYKIVNNTKWVFYRPEDQTELAEFVVRDTVIAEGNLAPSEAENLLYQTCYISGRNMGVTLCPHWNDRVERKFYSGPGTEMKSAARHIRKNNWYEAALIWNRLAEGSNRMLASRSAYNLALAWERDDELDQAFLWVVFADSLRNNPAIAAYRKTLDERLKAKLKLDEQMGQTD
ncbi:MAG TPA: DUF6340 family protein [Bacteroidales bacterium]|nr:DUF6340 family protein [Bacteroidales bacterium]